MGSKPSRIILDRIDLMRTCCAGGTPLLFALFPLALCGQVKAGEAGKPSALRAICPQPGAASACNSFKQLVEARDESILRALEPISYVCFHENEDVFFTLRVAPLPDWWGNYPTVLFFSEYEDGVSALSGFVQGMWTRDNELKESIFKSDGVPYNKASDKAEIDGLEVFLQYAF